MRGGTQKDHGRGGTNAHARGGTNYPFTWSLAERRILIVRQGSGRGDEDLRPRRKRKSEKGWILLQKGAADAQAHLRRRGVASQAASPAYQRSSRRDARPERHPPPTSIRGPRAVRRSWSPGPDETALARPTAKPKSTASTDAESSAPALPLRPEAPRTRFPPGGAFSRVPTPGVFWPVRA